eukprot:1254329-Amphidinium_carterae.1
MDFTFTEEGRDKGSGIRDKVLMSPHGSRLHTPHRNALCPGQSKVFLLAQFQTLIQLVRLIAKAKMIIELISDQDLLRAERDKAESPHPYQILALWAFGEHSRYCESVAAIRN